MSTNSDLNDGYGGVRIHILSPHDADNSTASSGIAHMLSKSAFEFPVFNGGARACLGKKMAERLAVGVISELVSKYEFREIMDEKLGGCGPGNDRRSKTSLTLPMEGGLPCHVRSRTNPFSQQFYPDPDMWNEIGGGDPFRNYPLVGE